MRLITIHSKQFNGKQIRSEVENRNVVLVKGLANVAELNALRQELQRWRQGVPNENPSDHYPVGKRNLHILAKNDKHRLNDKLFEYYEDHTILNVYNYRIGDMYHSDLTNWVPTFSSLGTHLLDRYQEVAQAPHLSHGNWDGPNLYFEIAHYPSPGGHIEKHTHGRNIEAGQTINMVTMASQKGRDFLSGGLFFESGSDYVNTEEDFEEGDSVFFRMDIPHGVTGVNSSPVTDDSKNNGSGRWTISTFFY